jgi:aspartate--ammonia ligase
MLRCEYMVYEMFPQIKPILPPEIHFIHAEELRLKYPQLSPKDREREITKEYGAVFIMGIGTTLADGTQHDLRAPDYDDWTSMGGNGLNGLNGDILIWNPLLDCAVEMSSMGIRVNKEALLRQLQLTNKEEKKELMFHKKLLNGELPQSIGGGIGQSRVCMFFLRKAHIGEIQASIWPESMRKEAADSGMFLI